MKKESGVKVGIFFLFLVISIIFLSSLAYSEKLVPSLDQALREGKLEKKVLEELKNKDEVSVIVILKDNPETNTKNLEIKKAAIKEQQETVLKNLTSPGKGSLGTLNKKEFRLKHQYSTINGFSGEVTKEGLERLQNDPKVEKIFFNRILKINLANSVPQINADKVWNLSINGHNITGEEETICIIDTGIDTDHSAFKDKILNQYCYCQALNPEPGYAGRSDCCPNNQAEDTNAEDDNGHGTHVAGIAAGNLFGLSGVASQSKIVPIKACDSKGDCSTDDVIAAIQWCTNNASLYNISVVSMSLGGGTYTDYCNSDSLAPAINTAVGQNISVVVASGNSGSSSAISTPACVQNATPVGSVNSDDTISSFSNRASIMNLFAPGESITASYLGGGTQTMGGTSMSTPHVSGAFALFRQYWRLAYNKEPTPPEIENKFIITGKVITDSGNSYSRIDVQAALQPYLQYVSETPADNYISSLSYIIINITSDVDLSSAILGWNYSNNTLRNYTMNQNNLSNFYYNITNLNVGTHTYKVYGNDSVNNFGTSTTRTVIIDNMVPNITFYNPQNNSYKNQFFYLNISINDSTLFYSNYSLYNSDGFPLLSNANREITAQNLTWTDLVNISNSTFSDDNYSLFVFANDSLGNYNLQGIIFIIDKTNPSIFAINIAPETIYNTDAVILTANITDANLNSSKLYLESNFSGTWINHSLTLETGNKYNFTINPQNLTNQKNIAYRFHAFDLANNLNTSETYNFTVQNRAPTDLNILSPTNGTVLELGNAYSFNASASDPDGDTLIYLWDFSDGTDYSLIQNSSHQFNSTGNFIIILNVSDSYSSFNLTNITLIVNDTQTPNLTSIIYSSSVNLGSETNQTVNASISDPSGIFNLTLYFNNTPQNRSCSSQTNITWTCSWSWNGLSLGNHNFTINLTDNFTTKHSTSSTYNFFVIGCGDSIKNGGETCDGSDLGGKTCVSQGYASGTLVCSSSCTLDTSSCVSSSSPGSSSGGSGGGGGGGGSTSSIPICTIGAINCQGSTQYKECLASGTKNAWSEIKNTPAQKECKSGSLVKIEETAQETTILKEIISPKQEKVEETNQSLTLNSDLSAKNLEEKTPTNTAKGTSLTGRAVGFIEKVSSGGTLYILIALVILLTVFYLLARKSR